MAEAARKSNGTNFDLRVTYKYDAWGNRVEKTVDPDGDTGSAAVATMKFAADGWNTAKSGPYARQATVDAIQRIEAALNGAGI